MQNNDLSSVGIEVWGKVQRVGFRNFVLEAALALGVKGYVQNQRDGSVFIRAEGNARTLHAFMELCQKGPPSSRVTEFKPFALPLNAFREFTIR